MLVSGTLLGSASAVGIQVFRYAINLVRWLSFSGLGVWLSSIAGWLVFLVPAIGGLVVGLVLYIFNLSEAEHGVTEVVEVTFMGKRAFPFRRVPARVGSAILSLGVGAPLGPEDPAVQIGGGLGALFGEFLHLPELSVQILIVAGAASAVAAAFNAPLTAMLFIREVFSIKLFSKAFSVIAVACAASAVITRYVFSAPAIFALPLHDAPELAVWPLFIGLGVIAGVVSALHTRFIENAIQFFQGWRVPIFLKPAATGIILGLVGLYLPQIFGIGHATMEAKVSGETIIFAVPFALLLARLVLTPLTFGSGFAGGFFAPSLYLGATLGASYGIAMEMLLPQLAISPATFAVSGMAAILAGTIHAPLAATILVFEIGGGFALAGPLAISSALGYSAAKKLQPKSIYAPVIEERLNLGPEAKASTEEVHA